MGAFNIVLPSNIKRDVTSKHSKRVIALVLARQQSSKKDKKNLSKIGLDLADSR